MSWTDRTRHRTHANQAIVDFLKYLPYCNANDVRTEHDLTVLLVNVMYMMKVHCMTLFLGHYDSKALPGAGVLPLLQSILCTFTNRCFQYPTSGDNRATIVPRTDST